MPELPEVETIKRQLSKKIIGKKLEGKLITNVSRRGKMLLINFSNQESLVFHLKMTGQLIFNGKKTKHTRQIFQFEDKSFLTFNDLRKFGWFKKVKDVENLKEIKQLGPDALSVNERIFQERLLKRKQAKIKPLLLDQKFISGIGNIYADEILFKAKINPQREVANLSPSKITALYKAIESILTKAVKERGSSSKDYLDTFGDKGNYLAFHKVYQKTNQPCPICKTPIQRIEISQRSSHFCPKCQV
ncbi:formamidopyrimidine-DNA glycosylase [bacterium (Candidatus Gribaldobacteria) CG23_combo_of_CG06-09_8_20_14_all_37_87_8]|uniref:Formamidopyrimidine-DNA glycosylase n=2 Tax=Candidatus Gribaldobacteria TaxID=2798536 RepID=A0A2G9ZER6_9BACT|nr:MAG: DNA-formamidopyrimidine glycosylase [Parcubacteria group bacterium CG1_02_37_13]PIP31666.1 MAG: formamidopyrimidine-DNA glycosylase [bacterium (Candidatus Gribaldobacteria) CG23_combo_of_CG06-09_8_20_14_all_37_87_8]PIR89969.1 MAG: formamidopyrimidine-DNA glycosylase [bacterium (Candidatus Gribaldobacteria) CG10_big_fil_rev_8_21_14_0_10_37_21]